MTSFRRPTLLGVAFASLFLVSARDVEAPWGRKSAAAAPPLVSARPDAVPAGWKSVGSGVAYRTYGGGETPLYHVARIDLRNPLVKVFVSGEADRGRSVTSVAARHDAIAAVNGDYFDESQRPIGFTQGPCGEWKIRGARSRRAEFALIIGDDRATVAPSPDRSEMPYWGEFALSGWPRVVTGCRALGSSELPGSDAFTRSRHARTAVGIDESGRTLFMITASPTQHVRGATLAELGKFMRDELGVCEGLNLDGGGSTTFVTSEGRQQPEAQFADRPVANHLVVVPVKKYRGCELPRTAVAEVSEEDRLRDLAEIFGGRVVDARRIVFSGGEARFTEDGSVLVTLKLPPERATLLTWELRENSSWSVSESDEGVACLLRGDLLESAHGLQRILAKQK